MFSVLFKLKTKVQCTIIDILVTAQKTWSIIILFLGVIMLWEVSRIFEPCYNRIQIEKISYFVIVIKCNLIFHASLINILDTGMAILPFLGVSFKMLSTWENKNNNKQNLLKNVCLFGVVTNLKSAYQEKGVGGCFGNNCFFFIFRIFIINQTILLSSLPRSSFSFAH